MQLSNELQKKYFDAVWRSISTIVARGDSAVTAIAQSNIFVKAWKEIVGEGINKYFKETLKELEAKSTDYYSQFTPPAISFKELKEKVTKDLGRNVAKFAADYKISKTVANATRAFAVSQMQAGLSFSQVRDGVEEFVKGSGQKLGVVDNFNLVQNRIQDTFAEYDRRLNNEYANRLNLNYFIYQGGEIKTTRDFCEERNGNVYTREEGNSWNSLQWEGKKGNIFIDAGGYNCRHYLDWISYELAKQLRPDIEQSESD